MPSLHKDPRGKSKYWYCAYTLANGVRRFRSTRQTKKGEAMKVAAAWTVAAQEAGNDHRDRELLDEMRRARGKGTINAFTIRKYLEAWLADQEIHLSPATHKRYGTSIRKFLGYLGEHADDELGTLTAETVEEFQRSELDAGLAPKTLSLDLKALRAALNRAWKRGYVRINVAATVNAAASDSVSRHAFTREQIGLLLKAVDEEWYGIILLGYHTGLRLDDCARLKWSNLDLKGKVISLFPGKRPKKSARPKHQEPIHNQLLIWFRLHRGAQIEQGYDGDNIFRHLAAIPVNNREGLSGTFSGLIGKAGIDNPVIREAKGTRGRRVFAYSFHSLRSTFISALQAAGVHEDIRMKLADHTTRSVHQLYSKTELSTLAKELNKLPAIEFTSS